MVDKPDIDDKRVRVALVGLGGHGHTIQDACSSAANIDVAAVYDVDEAELRAAADRFNCEVPPSYEAVLDRKKVDAVVLVTPNDLHRSQSEAALAGGLDVFVEKPIANTSADGMAIIQAAERADRLLMVGHNMRYARSTQKARERLSDGSLGQVVSVEIHFSADNTRRMSADAWRLRPDRCPLLPAMQLGIHGVDLVHYLLGPITAVHAVTRSVTTQPGVIDSVTAVFELDGGATGTLVTNYCTQALFEYRITGTDGTLRCTPHSYWFRSAEATDPRGEGSADYFDYSEHDRESYRLQMEAFGSAVRSRQRPDIDGWDGLQALAVIEALQNSAAERLPQTVATFTGRRGRVVSDEPETRLHG